MNGFVTESMRRIVTAHGIINSITMSNKVGVQDKIDKLLYDMSAVISLLHIVQEGMSTGHTDTEESAKAVYAVYCLMDGIRNELNNVAEEMDK